MANSDPDGRLRVGALASGGGTNLQAIIDGCASGACPADVVLVISNNSGAGALGRARHAGIPTCHLSGHTHPDPEDLDRAIRDALLEHGVQLVALAGYMKKLGTLMCSAYENRILNIHPALLPAFGGKGMFGMHVHEAVVASGVRYTGVTVHLADEDYDLGPIVDQAVVPVHQGDTPESLQQRVLQHEHKLYTSVITLFAEGKVSVDGRRVEISGRQ
jgi:phosphoribosylglycinamide formyltransferase-1